MFYISLGITVAAIVVTGIALWANAPFWTKYRLMALSSAVSIIAIVLFVWADLSAAPTATIGICLALYGALLGLLKEAQITRATAHIDETNQRREIPAAQWTEGQKDGLALGSWIAICVGFVLQIGAVTL